MTSVGPISGSRSSNLTPLQQRQPRKLNYLSCSFCRKAKVKCVPLSEAPAAKKCTRCSKKDLACSALTRKTNFRDNSIHEGYVDAAPAPIVPSSDVDVHDALVLLSLQHILGQAVDELLRIGQQQLMPLKGDSSLHAHGALLNGVVLEYTSLLARIQKALFQFTCEVAQTVLRASMDITYTPQFFDEANSLHELERILARYKAQKHHGVVTILRISKLRYTTYQSDANVQEMILDRNAFMDCLGEVLQKHNLKLNHPDSNHPDSVLIDLTKTQLFIPSALFQISGIVKAIRDDGRSDCLGRPVGHMFHDNKVDEQFRFTAYEDGEDVLGRSRIHIACSLTADQQVVSDIKEVPRSRWLTHNEMLGLKALDVAAIHGDLEVCTIIFNNYFISLHLTLLTRRSMFTERTCLHWAACFGHLAVVEHLLELCNTDTTWLEKMAMSTDISHDTPLHLAAHNGHLDVVKFLSQVTNWETMGMILSGRTPFGAATSGRHLEIMEFLEPFCDVNKRGYRDLTPLAEAARQGFFEGIRFLVQLDRVSLNSVSKHLEVRKGWVLMTPLDLAISGGHENCSHLLRQCGALTYSELKCREDLEVQRDHMIMDHSATIVADST